jgi:hypothetical protein
VEYHLLYCLWFFIGYWMFNKAGFLSGLFSSPQKAAFSTTKGIALANAA